MTQAKLTSGDLVGYGGFLGGNDGTMVLEVGPAGAKVTALSIDALGKVSLLQNSQPGWVLVSSQTASTSATIDFTGFSGTDDDYMVSVRNCVPAIDDSAIYMRVSQAAAFKTDATYNYAGLSVNASATTAALSGVGGTQMQLTGGISSTAVEGGTTGDVEVSSCSGAAVYKACRYDFEYFRTAVGTHHNKGGGAYRGSAAAVDGIRLFMSAGNITSGTFLLYKRRKS